MIINHHKRKTARAVKALAALALLSTSGSLLLTPATSHAADPYDKSLEARVEVLERELNIMEGDKKGKNVEESEVPTFLRAAGKQVQQLTIAGDLRFRYNYDNEQFQYPGAGNQLQRSRYLFRLRLNLNYTFNDNFFAGMGISTNSQADSQNQPITGGFDDYGVYLHNFFLGWKANEYATVVVGKIFAPFYDNEDALVDFGDITPTGLTEKFNFPITPQLNIAVNLGQYIFYDNPESGYAVTPTTIVTNTGGKPGTVTENVYSTNPAGTIPQSNKEDAILSYNDIIITYKPTNDVTVTVAPAFMTYLLHGSVGLSGNATGGVGRASPADVTISNPLQPNTGGLLNVAAFNSDKATDDLYIGFLDGDVKFPVGPFKGKVYYDFAYNFTGGARASHIYQIQESSFQDKVTWLAGFQLGELKKKHDFYASIDYRQYGVGSLDPNLNDPNFALSRLNTQGIRANLGFNITDWLKAEVWFYQAWNLEKNIHNLDGTRASNGTIRSFYDANSATNLILQLTSSF